MSNTARKARKRSGEKAPVKAPKIPTPPHERSFVTQPVQGPAGTKFQNYTQPRSAKKVEKYLKQFSTVELSDAEAA